MVERVDKVAIMVEYTYAPPEMRTAAAAIEVEYQRNPHIFVGALATNVEYTPPRFLHVGSAAIMVEYLAPIHILLDAGEMNIHGLSATEENWEMDTISITLDGHDYKMTQKTWRPAVAPQVANRLLLDGGMDTTWFAVPQYTFQGEIVAPVAERWSGPSKHWGTIETLRTTLAKRQKLALKDQNGINYWVVFIGPNNERSLSHRWDQENNIFYVAVQLIGIKDTSVPI